MKPDVETMIVGLRAGMSVQESPGGPAFPGLTLTGFSPARCGGRPMTPSCGSSGYRGPSRPGPPASSKRAEPHSWPTPRSCPQPASAGRALFSPPQQRIGLEYQRFIQGSRSRSLRRTGHFHRRGQAGETPSRGLPPCDAPCASAAAWFNPGDEPFDHERDAYRPLVWQCR